MLHYIFKKHLSILTDISWQFPLLSFWAKLVMDVAKSWPALRGLVRFRHEGWNSLGSQKFPSWTMAACSMCRCLFIKEVWLFAEFKEEKMAVGSLLCFYGLLSQNASTSLRVISARLSWQQCKYFIQWICPAVCVCMCAMILQWECIGGCLNLYIISWQEFNGLLLERMFYVT